MEMSKDSGALNSDASSWPKPRISSTCHSRRSLIASCRIIAPLGRPVEPDVKITYARAGPGMATSVALGGVGAEPPVAEVDGHGFRFARVVLAGVVELHHDPGVVDDDGPARGGPLRVERHERAPRLEHAEQADHHLGGAAQRDADDLFGGESALDQVVGQLAGQLGRFTVGQRPVLVDDGDGVRPGPRLLAEHLHDGRADPVGLGVVPPGQGREPRRHAGRADGADGPVREVGQVVQRELRVGRRDALGDGDAPAVRADLPAAGCRPRRCRPIRGRRRRACRG